MKIRNYLIGVLFFVISNSNALAGNVIGWSISPSGLPTNTQTNYSYRFTYTLFNNHPVISIPIHTSEVTTGCFTIVDNCNGVSLAPKGQVNSSCNILVTYSPSKPMNSTLQVKLTYGSNQVLLPAQSTQTTQGPTTATQGRLIGYMPGYLPPSSAQSLFTAGYTDILVAFGVFSTSQPGTIVSAFSTISPALIQEMKTLGIRVLLSLGGASSNIPNTTVNFHQALAAAANPTAFKAAFIASLESLIAQYGFDGFDFDIEFGLDPGAGGTISNPGGDIAVLADIINQMHTLHPSVLLTLAPQTVNISAGSAFGSQYATYSSLIMQTYSALTWVGIQIYNSGTIFGIDGKIYTPSNPNSPDASVALAADLLENWPQGFLPYLSMLTPSQVVLGYLAPNAAGQVDGGPPAIPLATIKRAIQCLRTGTKGPNSCDTYAAPKVYPGLGGVFAWQTYNDQNNNFGFAMGLTDCVLNGKCF